MLVYLIQVSSLLISLVNSNVRLNVRCLHLHAFRRQFLLRLISNYSQPMSARH